MQEAPTFFPTIEDFLWYKLALVRPEARGASVSFVGGGSSGACASEGRFEKCGAHRLACMPQH